MKKLLLVLIALCTVLSINATDYYAINDGPWTVASNWSETSGGSPSTKAPKQGDVVYIEDYHIILDIDLDAQPGISLSIEEGGSLIAESTQGVFIKAQGFLNVNGLVEMGSLDMKNDAVVNIFAEAVLTLGSWINPGNLVNANGQLFVTGTFTNIGTVVGTGNVTAGHYVNTGSIFCITTTPPDGATVFGNGWNGGTTGDEYNWNNPLNWCSGYVPGDSVRVTIESSTLFKDIVITSAAQCRSLELEPGINLTVSPGTSLSVGDTLRNNGALILQSSAAGTAVLLDAGLNYGSGVDTVEVYLADFSTTTAYYHQVCAPVDNQILDDFDVRHGSTYAFEFNPSANDWVNIYGEWRLMPPMKGIMLSTLNSSGQPNTIQFAGPRISGDKSISIEANAWNLVGNPYPSPISWDSIIPYAGISNIVYVWDPASDNYVSYVEGTGGSASCQHIQIGQSFFIYSSGATTFQLTNDDRVINRAPFLKSDPANYLRLYTSGGNQSSDEVHIRLIEGATKNYDAEMEAEKWPSISESPATEMYTVTDNGVNLQINALPMLNSEEITVPLHFMPAVAGNYTIYSEFISSFDPSVAIYLEDKSYSPSLMINLRQEGSYTFNAALDNDPARFVIHFSDEPSFGISEEQESLIRLGQGTGQFILENPGQENIVEVKVFGITGAEVASYGPTSSSRETYDIPAGQAAYIVRILTDKQVLSRKLIVR